MDLQIDDMLRRRALYNGNGFYGGDALVDDIYSRGMGEAMHRRRRKITRRKSAGVMASGDRLRRKRRIIRRKSAGVMASGDRLRKRRIVKRGGVMAGSGFPKRKKTETKAQYKKRFEKYYINHYVPYSWKTLTKKQKESHLKKAIKLMDKVNKLRENKKYNYVKVITKNKFNKKPVHHRKKNIYVAEYTADMTPEYEPVYKTHKKATGLRADYIDFIKSYQAKTGKTYKRSLKDVSNNGLWEMHKMNLVNT